jgi:hypothetical protein
VEGRGQYCLTTGGLAIEQAVAKTFLEAVTPAAAEAMRLTVEQLQTNHDAALSQWRLEVERARYEAEKVERRYRTVEPENRLVARGLETEWESRLRDLATAEAELRIQREILPAFGSVPNGDPFLTYGIWVLPFSRTGAASEVFLVDRNITSQPDHAKAKEEVADKLNQLIAGPELG